MERPTRALLALLVSMLGLLLVVVLGIMLVLSALTWLAKAIAAEIPPPRVRICHATASEDNPFTSVEVDADGLHGHDEHEGDVFPPLLPDYPDGQNWDDAGQELWENGCSFPDPSPPVPDPVPPPSPDVPEPSPSPTPPSVVPPDAGGVGSGRPEPPEPAAPPESLVQEGF